MAEQRDSIYYMQLARVARLKANAAGDADLARRLRETAVRYERKARQLATIGKPFARRAIVVQTGQDGVAK